MSGFRRIFLGIDFSPASDEALRQAHNRATSNVRLAVCHIIPNELRSNVLYPRFSHAAAINASLNLLRTADDVAARVRQVTGRTGEEFDLVVDHGTPYAAFLASAEDWGADLIIVGSQGNTCASEFPLGAMTRQVIRHAHCAVLVARPHKETKQIVAGTDFSDSSMPALKAADDEARRTGAALTIVHCVDLLWPPSMQPAMSAPGAPPGLFEDGLKEMERASKEKLDAALKELGIDARASVTVGQAAPDLVEIVTHLDADLLVVGTLGRTGLRRALLGSVAEAVATNAPCSVLVARLNA